MPRAQRDLLVVIVVVIVVVVAAAAAVVVAVVAVVVVVTISASFTSKRGTKYLRLNLIATLLLVNL